MMATFTVIIAAVTTLLVASPAHSCVDPGEPLFLTPYITAGKCERARELSRVEPLVAGLDSYSGLITVNNKTKSNLYFWAVKHADKAPLIVWLQGGPGSSSLFGLFAENGPIQVDVNNTVSRRAVGDWSARYNMVWVDSPVGTGFSFTGDKSGYCNDEDCIADDLYWFLVQFYQLFPELLHQPLYLAGESYAGKYIPALAMKLVQMEVKSRPKVVAKLSGILVGNGYSDPESMLPTFGDLMHSLGLLDEGQREYFNSQIRVAVDLIRQKKYREAFDAADFLMDGDFFPYPTYLQNASGCPYYFNFLVCKESPPELDYYATFVQLNETRAKIHVGSLPFVEAWEVEIHLLNEMMDSVKTRLEYLLQTRPDVKVLYYSGHLDLSVPTVATDAFLRALNWPLRAEWLQAERQVWRDGDNKQATLGYRTTVGQLSFVIIRNAGHMVPSEQPETAMKMVSLFIDN